jgi:hypothetical protein
MVHTCKSSTSPGMFESIYPAFPQAESSHDEISLKATVTSNRL